MKVLHSYANVIEVLAGQASISDKNLGIETLFNPWITRGLRNELLSALQYANVSLGRGCRHRS